MNREIKFRYLYADGKNWVKKEFHLEQIVNGEPFDVLSDAPLLKNYKHVGQVQYTGLKDRNGVEIYEGDILSGHSDGNVKVVFLGACWQCIFSDEGNIGLDEMCIWFGNRATVIGNIHEHPHLLNQEAPHES